MAIEPVILEPRESHEDIWRRIVREALEVGREELERLQNVELVFGDHIAWIEYGRGRAGDLSPMHRVGFPIGDKPYTTCSERIPGPACWLTLGPGLRKTMELCRFCESEYQRAARANGSVHAA